MTILILGAGTQALAIVRQLSESGYRIVILVAEKGNYADVSRYIDKRLLCDLPVDSEDFLMYVEQVIEQQKVEVILPMGDIYVEFLSKNKDRLNKQARFTVPSDSDFFLGYDKNKLMAICKEKGYPHPQTIDMSMHSNIDADELKLFPYPAMLKPNCTTGGRGMVQISSHNELKELYPALHHQYGEYHLQRFIRAGGRQVKIQLCVDSDGNLLCHSALHKVRWYPVKGGASSCSVSIIENKMTEICYQILKDIRWEGFADFDLIEDPDTNQLLIMEINPRFPACVGAAVSAGIEWGEVMVNLALGKSQKMYSYKEGVALRHLGFDVLWFLKSPRRFHTVPSWFKFFGSNVYYQDFHIYDQKPFWVGTYHNIKKLMDPSFRQSKKGA